MIDGFFFSVQAFFLTGQFDNEKLVPFHVMFKDKFDDRAIKIDINCSQIFLEKINMKRKKMDREHLARA